MTQAFADTPPTEAPEKHQARYECGWVGPERNSWLEAFEDAWEHARVSEHRTKGIE